ncbi:hypothetical protein PROFUN_13680 [Planoprotostelium fungivorum]|uniref:Phosphatidylserine decarboxylase n=1 Tax=Planoprotostelium fungivorum TaxID=1890364 RepID=A0A2P6N3A9_9EUKA|nr:hypothetical protein PROFUN_13680 [Planoprotostelium fungivorum]
MDMAHETSLDDSVYQLFLAADEELAPAVVSRVQGLFALNERVVPTGEWPHGFFSYTPVGATNVSSIKLEFDDVKTNVRPKLKDKHYNCHYDDVNAKKGDCLGFFHMGSTIVLIFESPEYDFMVQSGQKIQMGQPIRQLRDRARELNLKDVKGRGLTYAGWWFPRAWRLRLSCDSQTKGTPLSTPSRSKQIDIEDFTQIEKNMGYTCQCTLFFSVHESNLHFAQLRHRFNAGGLWVWSIARATIAQWDTLDDNQDIVGVTHGLRNSPALRRTPRLINTNRGTQRND